MSKLQFVVVGDNTIDRYIGDQQHELVGGNAVNVAAQLALSGEKVRYYGAIADDKDGAFIRTALVEAGVDIRGLVIMPGVTAVTVIRVLPDGDRAFEREDFGVTAQYVPTPEQVQEIAEGDWVQIGMLPDADSLRAQLVDARIGQDCAVASGFTGLAVAFGSVGVKDPAPFARAALDGGAEVAVVTRGPLGAVGYPGICDPITVSAAPTSVVDTTGAGDSFIAGFISARAAGSPVSTALARGARWAAITCGHRGGFPQETKYA